MGPTEQFAAADAVVHTAAPGDRTSEKFDRSVTEAAGGAGVAPESGDASRARLGEAFADALLLDQQAGGGRARSLGWAPKAPTLVEELRAAGRTA